MSISKRPYPKFIGFIIVLIVLLLFLFNGNLRSLIQDGFGYLVSPLYTLSQDLSNRFSDKADLEQENEFLQQRLSQIIVDYAELQSIKQENGDLRKELDYIKKEHQNKVIADVLAETNLPGFDMLLINKGQNDGIIAGMPAVYQDGILVGKIYKTENNSSYLLLVNNNNSTLSATVQNEQNTTGVVTGQHNLSMTMEFVPLDQNLQVDQIVITSGRENYIPAGLIIGQITSVDKSDNEFFQSANVTSPVKFSNIRQVMVLLSNNE